MKAITPTPMMTAAEVRDAVGISPATLWRWRTTNPAFPKAVHVGPRAVRFIRAEIEAYLANCRRAGVPA